MTVFAAFLMDFALICFDFMFYIYLCYPITVTANVIHNSYLNAVQY